jgi:predicted  nucleic acid-binding Zn ribbon protein
LYLAEVVFRLNHSADQNQVRDLVERFACACRKNGQVLGPHFPIVQKKTTINLFLSLPERTSLATSHHNRWIRSVLKKIKAAGTSGPILMSRGKDLSGSSACNCRRHSTYILFTTYLERQSPLRCGNCFLPVPLYRIMPWRDHEFSDVLSWESNYRSCDRQYIDSGTCERFGLRQTTNLQSALSKDGRNLCSQIEKRNRKPVYYFLHHPSGRSYRKELTRRCPSCGQEWRLKATWHDLFDFRCDRCRLVSNIAWDFQNHCKHL